MTEGLARPNPDRHWRRGKNRNVLVRHWYDSVDGVTVWESKSLHPYQQTRLEDVGGGWRRIVTNEGLPGEYAKQHPPSYQLLANIPDHEDVPQNIQYYPFAEDISLINAIDFPKHEGEDGVFPGFRARYNSDGKLVDFAIRVNEKAVLGMLPSEEIPYISSLREIAGLLRAGADAASFVPHEGEEVAGNPDDPNYTALFGVAKEVFKDVLAESQIEAFASELYNLSRSDSAEASDTLENEFASIEDIMSSHGVNPGFIPSLNKKAFEIFEEHESQYGIQDPYELIFSASEKKNVLLRTVHPEFTRDAPHSRVRVGMGKDDAYKSNVYHILKKGKQYLIQFMNVFDPSQKIRTVTIPEELSDMPEIGAWITTRDHTDWQYAVPLVPIHYEEEVAA